MICANVAAENFELFVNNVHCKHILLAGSSDNGYVGFLRQYFTGTGVDPRITLVEAVPFPHAFREITTHSQIARFPAVFRSTKITIESQPTKPATVPCRTSYASATNQLPAVAATSPVAIRSHQVVPNITIVNGTSTEPEIRLNRLDQRLDPPLPRCSPDIVPKVQNLRLCNRHYLSKCVYGEDCTYRHKYPLIGEEKLALVRVARRARCWDGTLCRDKDCVASHQCAYGDRCERENCEWDHITDKVVAKVV